MTYEQLATRIAERLDTMRWLAVDDPVRQATEHEMDEVIAIILDVLTGGDAAKEK